MRKMKVIPKKGKGKKKLSQPEPRRYKGVFWNGALGKWVGQKTNPPGHTPRQQQVCWNKSQKKCAAQLAKALAKTLEDLLLPGLGPVDRNRARLYKGVTFREEYGTWQAQITMPAGETPRQVTVGQRYSSQKEAATAMCKKMNELKMKVQDEKLGKARKWKLSDLTLKKAQVYQGSMAMLGQVKKFKIWNRMFVKRTAKKSWNPGAAPCLF